MRTKHIVLWGLTVGAGAVAASFIAMCSMWPPDVDFERTTVSPAELKECERVMQLKFPETSRPEGIFGMRWLDTVLNLKVSMNRGDVEEFLENSPFADTNLDAGFRHVLKHDGDPDWWDPDTVQRFESGAATIEDDGVAELRILISHDDPQRALVYLTWFDT